MVTTAKFCDMTNFDWIEIWSKYNNNNNSFLQLLRIEQLLIKLLEYKECIKASSGLGCEQNVLTCHKQYWQKAL